MVQIQLTERFLGNDSWVIGRIVNDCWLYEESLGNGDIGATDSELVTFGFTIREKSFNFLILHLILDWPKQNAILVTRANLYAFGKVYHGLNEWAVNILVNVDSLRRYANLG